MAFDAARENKHERAARSKEGPSPARSGGSAMRDRLRATPGYEAQVSLLKPAASPPAAPSAAPETVQSTGFSEVIRRNFSRLDKSGNGYISQAEVNAALADPSFTGGDAAAVAALHKYMGLLEELSNDELLDENDGLTLNDLLAYEKGALKKKLEGDLRGVEGNRGGGMARISRARLELFPNGVPTLAALGQGALGDCYFLAAMGSFIARDPAALTRMIKENRQGTTVSSYTITFPGKLGAVTVAPPTDAEIARYSSAGADGLWLNVMEKAYAVARTNQANPDVQEEIGEGGMLRTGISAFTAAGIDGDILLVTSRKTTVGKLDAAFGRGQGKDAGKRRLVTASIATGNKRGLPKGHAYSVIGWDGTNLVIRNPWGFLPAPPEGSARLPGPGGQDAYANGIFLMSLDEFEDIFMEITYEE